MRIIAIIICAIACASTLVTIGINIAHQNKKVMGNVAGFFLWAFVLLTLILI